MYYQLNHSDTYHFCENCHLLKLIFRGAMERYKVTTGKPRGDACNFCKRLQRVGFCNVTRQ